MPDSTEPPRSLSVRGPLGGVLAPPVSKSQAQRALVLAALAPGDSRLIGIDERPATDVADALALVRTLGRPVREGSEPRVRTVAGAGCGHAGGIRPLGPLQVGESGTLARIATALAGLTCSGSVEVVGRGTMARRRAPALMAALERAGAHIEHVHDAAPGGWPVLVEGVGPPPDLELREPGSSQELTALLLAAAGYPDAIQVHLVGELPSRPYVELTRDLLGAFGVQALEVEPLPGRSLCLEVRGALKPTELELEPDASAAAVGLCAAALSGGSLTVPGPWAASRQGDADAPAFLAAFGIDATRRGDALLTCGTVTRGADLDLSGHPDLAPPLAALAAAAAMGPGETSSLAGLGTLRGKESDRLEVLVGMLTAAGVAARVEGDTLRVAPERGTSASPGPVTLDPVGDHRMAFAGALLGLLRPGIQVADPMVVQKSWPSFWEAMGELAATGSGGVR